MGREYTGSIDTAPGTEPTNPEILYQSAFDEAVLLLLEERSIIGDRAQIVGAGNSFKPGIRISKVNNGIATLITDYPEFFTAFIQKEPFEARHAAVISANALTEQVATEQLTLADTDESALRLTKLITGCVDRLGTVTDGTSQQAVCENSLAILNEVVHCSSIDQDYKTLAQDAVAYVYQNAPQAAFGAIIKRFGTFTDYEAEGNGSRLDSFTASFRNADINTQEPAADIVSRYRAEQQQLLDAVANEGLPYTQRLWSGKLLDTLSAVFPKAHETVMEERRQETITLVRKNFRVA